jgi:hypothetical protein
MFKSIPPSKHPRDKKKLRKEIYIIVGNIIVAVQNYNGIKYFVECIITYEKNKRVIGPVDFVKPNQAYYKRNENR